jgi:hypothetical protein
MRLENLDGLVERASEYERAPVTSKIAAISYTIASKGKKLLPDEKKQRAVQNLCAYCGEPNHTILNRDLAFKNRTRYDTQPNDKQLVSAIIALEQDKEMEKTQTNPPIRLTAVRNMSHQENEPTIYVKVLVPLLGNLALTALVDPVQATVSFRLEYSPRVF